MTIRFWIPIFALIFALAAISCTSSGDDDDDSGDDATDDDSDDDAGDDDAAWKGFGAAGTPGAAGSKWYENSGTPDPGTGASGDYYLRTATGDIYTKSGNSWGSPIENIKGAEGSPGPKGREGSPGPCGPCDDDSV